MEQQKIMRTGERSSGIVSGKVVLVGVVGALAAMAWMSMGQKRQHSRRYSDRSPERRDPMHFFLAGRFPQRREIDRSGKRPLFERRQSVYDAY